MDELPAKIALRTLLVTTATVATTYFLVGAFSIWFIPVSNYPVSVWPAAGVALGATLLTGRLSLPGIFLGSLAINVYHAYLLSDQFEGIATLVRCIPLGFAALLQAYLSANLIQLLVGTSVDLSRISAVLKFLLSGGPLGCTVSATLSVGLLYFYGKIPAQDFARDWLTWWSGDTIGVLTVTPIMLAIFAKPRNIWRGRAKFIAAPLTASLITVLGTFYQSTASERANNKANFAMEADFMTDDLNNGLINYTKTLKTLEAFYQTSGPDFSNEKFSEFTRSVLTMYPGIRALSWNPLVTHEERPAFEARMQKEGLENFAIRELAENGEQMKAKTRRFYTPVAYIEPFEANAAAVGFDINSDPVRARAIKESLRSLNVTATDIIRLVQMPDHAPGLLMVHPVSAGGSRDSISGMPAIAGFVVAVLAIEETVQSIVGTRLKGEHLDLQLDDSNGQNIYTSGLPQIRKYTEFAHVNRLTGVAGADWVVTVLPTATYFIRFGEFSSGLLLIGGLAFTGLLGTFLLVLLGRNEMLSSETLEKLRAKAALAAAEARKAAALEVSLDAIVCMDTQERIVDFNRSAEKIFGYRREDVLGRSLSDMIIPERFRDAHKNAVLRYTKSHQSNIIGGRVEVFAMRSDGSEFPVEIAPVVNDIDGEMYFTGVIRDITEQKNLEKGLKMAKEAAEAANAAKSGFLANMSHEIRTPLAAVLGFSELIASQQVTEQERSKYLDIIKRNGALLSNVIDDILDLSKVEAGKIDIEIRTVSVEEVLSDIQTLLGMQAPEKGIELVIDCQPGIPEFVVTDPLRLRQILLNIVGNAVKFTAQGRVTVVVSSASMETDVDKLVFSVIDTGTGIAPEQAKQLFQPFTQADVSTKRRYGGTGLGLVLAKRLAILLGGDVQLTRSEAGVGSCFTVTIAKDISLQQSKVTGLDVVTAKNLSPAPSKPKVLGKPLQDVRILVTEDAPDIRLLVSSLLTFAGASVELAENGQQAIDKIHRKEFDVVLMDLQMPVMDGYEATKSLRGVGCEIPIVALTAHASKDQMDICTEIGFTSYLSKPIQSDRLIDTLQHLLQI